MSPEVHRPHLDRDPVAGGSPTGTGSRADTSAGSAPGSPAGPPTGPGSGRGPGQGPGTADDFDGAQRHDSIVNDETAALIDDGAPGAPTAAGTAGSESALETVRRERDEYLDMVRRVQADFENYKKRMQRQQSDSMERASENLVTKLLPALDALDLARAHLSDGESASDDVKALLQATGLITDALAKDGLERIDEPGAAFDPTVHDAVEHAAADDDAASGVVDGVLRAGYRWKGRVIRPAMVRVRG
ncbi:MAG TPA: nucleotide exchange factor GrpE [Acidimicrobiales bacterium]|nr:nucleotide exchange factor GrpE [Acidimicrobiales bacterium]